MSVNRVFQLRSAGGLAGLRSLRLRGAAKLCVSLAALLVVLAVGASPVLAAEPWWHIATISSPAGPTASEGLVTLEVTNVGDASAGGTLLENLTDESRPITVVDQLPAGITATQIHPEGGGGNFDYNGDLTFASLVACSIAGQTVTCHYGVPVQPYENIEVAIDVKVASGGGRGENEVRVSGGGAPAIVSRHSLAVAGPVPSFGVQSYELLPEEEGGVPDTQAGSHPFQLTTSLIFNTQATPVVSHGDEGRSESGPEVEALASTKDLRFDLPAGLIGNPAQLPKCSVREFTLLGEGGVCPNDTVVGVASPIIENPILARWDPWITSWPLYSLEPSVGEPAKFGFKIPRIGPVILDTSVRTGGDYGVVITVPDITEDATFLGNLVTFWGVPGDARHDNSRNRECLVEEKDPAVFAGGPEPSCPTAEKPQPLLIMPTVCAGAPHTTVEADSWSEIGKFTAPFEYTFQNGAGEPVSEDGCDKLNFDPSIGVSPDGQQASSPTGLTVGIHVAQEASQSPSGLAESAVKSTTVELPAGVGLNPAGADGLSACGLGEIALESPAEQTCPESSKVGTVEIKTPLLPNPLVGAVYLAQQDSNPFGSLIALYIVARDPVSGVLVKLAGEVKPNPVTGQLVSTFKETPQLPFEDLYLSFFGGSRAPLGTPALCGGYTTRAAIEPWSGNAAVNASSEFQIVSGPNGSPCADPLPFGPSLSAGTTSIQAGGLSPFTMTMGREDGQQNLQAIQLHMPPGLSGMLSAVKLCGEAQADAGTCGPESLIGTTTVSVGLGSNPYAVTGGKVYITGPYRGAPFGLSIVNPANAGPFHLGNVIVRAKIEVDEETAALTITSDNEGPYKIPSIIDGIPLQIQHVNVTIDRPGFTFNPTNCSPLRITGSLTSTEGASRALAVPFQVTNCAVLAFKPKLTAKTPGTTSRADGAGLSVKLAYPAGPYDANISRVKVELPKKLPSRLTTLQKACTVQVFAADPAGCPAASIVGHAKATTPVLPVPLEGPAYFVSHGGEAFPSLIVVLQGYGVTVHLVGSTNIDGETGITSSTFKTVPDVPVGTFELTLPEGPYSALAANGNLCKSKLAMPTEFIGQNGAGIHQSTPIEVEGCATTLSISSHAIKKTTAILAIYVPAAGKVKVSGVGLPSKSITAMGRETLRVTLTQRKGGRLKTRVAVVFTPSAGKDRKKQSESVSLKFKR